MRSWFSSMVAGCVSCYVRQALIIPSYEFLGGVAQHTQEMQRTSEIAEATVVVDI